MQSLPMESLTHILQYLSPIDRLHAEKVCKKWKDASRQTWRGTETLYIIKPNHPNYHYRFKDCTDVHRLFEIEGNRLFIGSDSLEIIGCLVSRVGCFIRQLICHYPCSENSRAILSIISRYCHNLKVLELGQIVDCDQTSFSRLFELNEKLHSVMCAHSLNSIEAVPFRNWRSLRLLSAEPDDLFEEKIISLLEHSDDLEEFQSNDFTTRSVEALLKLPNVKSLYFTPDHPESSIEIIFHVPLLNKLRNLVIGHVKLETQLLCNLLQHCSQLKRLMITRQDFPMMLLEAILALPNLETLGLCCPWIAKEILIRLTKFRNLSVKDTFISAKNNVILQMIRESEVLEKLDISKTKVTPKIFKQLVEETSDRQKYLEVAVSSEIFDEVKKICAGSKILLTLEFQCFREYTD